MRDQRRDVHRSLGGTPFSGKERGPKRQMVLLNAATALACAGLADHIGDGLAVASEAIDSGEAMQRLERLRKASTK